MEEILDLSYDEIAMISAGLFPALAGLAFAVISAFAAGGYMVGKDMAERDNARLQKK